MDSSANTPAKPNPEQVEIFLPSTLGYEKVARSAAEAVAEEMGFSADRIEDLKTAVAEACMNAIEHGNHADQTTSVTVLLTAANKQLEIKVNDEGRTPMPDVLPTPGRPGTDEAGSRGWGMFFISHLVDEMEIKRLPEGGNQVRMVIYLTPADDKSKDNPNNLSGPTSAGNPSNPNNPSNPTPHSPDSTTK